MRPDFVIIGAMKCATSTLSAQLGAQPGVFVTEPKEPNFFSDDDVYARGIGWYEHLFAGAAPGEIRGEASTHYTKLPTHPRTVERISAACPDLRLVYVIRHPIERLISHFVHAWSMGECGRDIEAAVRSMPQLVDYGRYAMQLEPWLDAYGAERILLVVTEQMRAEPREQLERAASHVGAPGPVSWRDDQADVNVSAERLRRSPVRDAIVGAPVLSTIRRRLIPRAVRDRVKGRWRMRDRPELSPATRRDLELRFDDDLARLSEWLEPGASGPVSCETFANARPRWRQEVAR